VQSFPPSGAKFQISTGGGNAPEWRKDGAELFYVAADQTLTAVPVKLDANSFQADVAKPLFALPPGFNFFVTRIYAASHDGQRFLVPTASGGSTTPLTVVLNWQTGLKK